MEIKKYYNIEEGKIYNNNTNDDFEVLKIIDSGKVLIKFLKTNSIKYVKKQAILTGKIKDRFKPSVYGIGFIGNGKSKVNDKFTKEYVLWRNMIDRCYNIKNKAYHNYGGKGVIVDERWHNFENFCLDIIELNNYEKWKYCSGHEWSLDKDMKQSDIDFKTYSKYTCVFASVQDQNDLAKSKRVNGFIDGKLIFDFKSDSEAGRYLGITASGISQCCVGKVNTNGKYNNKKITWKYVED